MQVMLPREQEGPRAAGKLRKMYGTSLQSSIPRNKEAGVFIHQLPLGHWLRAASRHISSPVLPTYPELVPRVFPPPGKTLRQRAGVGSKKLLRLEVSARDTGWAPAPATLCPSLPLLDFSFLCAFVGSWQLPLFSLKCLVFSRLLP